MSQSIEKRASFERIRYASCWEDTDVLIEALNLPEGANVLSIASAGDNSFAILTKNPSLVVAADLSIPQLACVELKKVSFANLDHEELLMFLGVSQGSNRLETYKKLRNDLPDVYGVFWDAHPKHIDNGIIHCGKFENYFRLFRNRIIPFIHSRKTVDKLLAEKDENARCEFYERKWDTWRWRLLFKMFFSRYFMGRLGRDPEFFKYVDGNVSDRILQRTKYALTKLETHSNPYLDYILTGNYTHCLPFYLREENYDAIRRNLDKLQLMKGPIDQAGDTYKDVRFNGFNLSDIFEYMDTTLYESLLKKLVTLAEPGARFVYWNMLVDRRRPESMKHELEIMEIAEDNLFSKDKAFFYKALRIEELQ